MKMIENVQVKINFRIMNQLKFTGLLVVLSLFLSSCGLFQQSKQIERFSKCKFEIQSWHLETLMGRNMSQVKNVSDLDFKDLIVFTSGLMNGDLPATIQFKIRVSNPFDQEAAISGLDWELLQKGRKIAYGVLNKKIKVAPKKTSSFDFIAKVNINKFLEINSIDRIFDIMSGKLDQQMMEKMGLTFQIKPYFLVNGELKKFPGYITIQPRLSN